MTKKSYPFRMDVTQTKVFSVVVEATSEADAKYKAERLVAENGDTLKSRHSEELAEPAKFFPLGTYRCTKGLSHPNLGPMFTKGKVYRLENPSRDVAGEFIVGGWMISTECFMSHFDTERPVTARVFKLVRVKGNQCFPLFIDAKKPFEFGKVMPCEYKPTKGFAPRSVGEGNIGGWHCCFWPVAPHLSEKLKTGEERVWMECEASGRMTTYHRGAHQGGDWILVENLKPIRVLTSMVVQHYVNLYEGKARPFHVSLAHISESARIEITLNPARDGMVAEYYVFGERRIYAEISVTCPLKNILGGLFSDLLTAIRANRLFKECKDFTSVDGDYCWTQIPVPNRGSSDK